jgi:hypothetical protein
MATVGRNDRNDQTGGSVTCNEEIRIHELFRTHLHGQFDGI